jgi:hypothetical protein
VNDAATKRLRDVRSGAIFEAAYSRRRDMPVTQLLQGQLSYRGITSVFSNPREARKIRPDASQNTKNRWDSKVSSNVMQGGLNMSLDSKAARNEALYYSRLPGKIPTFRPDRGYIRHTVEGVHYDTVGRSAGEEILFIEKVFYVYTLRTQLMSSTCVQPKAGSRNFCGPCKTTAALTQRKKISRN